MTNCRIIKKDRNLKGLIHLPASKSESNRALIIRALCKTHFSIENLSEAEDTQILKKILDLEKKSPPAGIPGFDAGAAGTTFRFLTAYFSIRSGKKIILTGSKRMKERPVKILVQALRDLGAEIEYLEKNGYPPLKITGKILKGGAICIDGSVSSQYISALLMIGPILENGLVIEFKGALTSRPYVEMTLKIMKHFGIDYLFEGNRIVVGSQSYKAIDFTVESDWSAASYWYQMVAFSSEADIFLPGLKERSQQGDSVVSNIFEQLGVKTVFLNDGVLLTKAAMTDELQKIIHLDFSDFPDLAQTVAVTCAGLGLAAKFTGLKTLRIKETDRIKALHDELMKVGAETEIIGDDLLIKKSKIIRSAGSIATYNDHRMAMAFAPLAMLLGEVVVEDRDVVRKSYPHFWADLKKADFVVEFP